MATWVPRIHVTTLGSCWEAPLDLGTPLVLDIDHVRTRYDVSPRGGAWWEGGLGPTYQGTYQGGTWALPSPNMAHLALIWPYLSTFSPNMALFEPI